MLGAIAGDVIGSRFEFNNHRSRDFELFLGDSSFFTDDTALTVATAKWLLGDDDLAGVIIEFFNRYPHLSYGGSFYNWARSGGGEPYNSYGNGSAMRVSPVAYAARDEQDCLALAEESAAVTHSHPEGIKGAQAVALGVLMGRKGCSKKEIREKLETGLG